MKNIIQFGFTFDTNKCVGCQACQIACSIENDLGYDFSWREINTYNPDQLDILPHYHLSIACNHCRQPICLYQCPAKAIKKNPDNGIVIIEENKCIGCKFCSWVCPYDAPKYSSKSNEMTKCTLCIHRIEENLQPACVSICPTDALNISQEIEFSNATNIAGFPESEIKPSIQIETLKPDQQLPEQFIQPYSNEIIEKYTTYKEVSKSKINLSDDWTLVIFTFLISVLGGWLSASVLGNQKVSPILFGLIGLVGMSLSTLHLGKKFSAYRAIFNFKTSWLSREIVFFSLFMVSAAVYLFFPEIKWLGYLTLLFVFFTAISADNVYHIVAKTHNRFFHSAQVWLTTLFFIALFNQYLFGVTIIVAVKLILYVKRKIENHTNKILTVLRIACLLVGFVLFILNLTTWSIFIFIISELIDRCEFYIQQTVITPKIHINAEFLNKIA